MARFSSFDGTNIIATINGQVIGELQSITYDASVNREPAYIESTNQFRETFGLPRYTQGTFTLNDSMFTISEPVDMGHLYERLINTAGVSRVLLEKPKNNAEAKQLLRKGEL